MNPIRFVPLIVKQVWRHRVRTLLTAAGIAIAMFLFTAVQAMHAGVADATRVKANDTTLVVYRKDRFCPATSELPRDYVSRIERIEGVVSAVPVKVVVTNCRTSLDVVTFRGVPKEQFLQNRGKKVKLTAGSFDDWLRRSDAALLGETLAKRRGLRPGMTFDAAGITAYVAGVIASDNAQDENVAYASLDFIQLASRAGLGSVTQFEVKVADASLLDSVAAGIDETFRSAQEPTATFTEQAFLGRIADDVIELVGFARWLGVGCLAAILALVANAIVLSVQSRIAEHAVMQTLGFGGPLLAGLIVAEGGIIALAGGAIGAAAAAVVAGVGSFALSVEGQSILINVDAPLILTGMAVCAALGVFAGLVPAWQASRREIAACFRAV